MTDDHTTPPHRPRGRPRVNEPLERVSTRLPLPYYDRLTKLANKRGTSVSQLVRSLLMTKMPAKE